MPEKMIFLLPQVFMTTQRASVSPPMPIGKILLCATRPQKMRKATAGKVQGTPSIHDAAYCDTVRFCGETVEL